MPVGVYTGAQVSIGNGVTTVFPYGWKILDQTHIEVKVDGVVKALGADYAVSGLGASAGGNVTFVVAPANGAVVQRARKVPYKRDTDYQANGDFKEETVDSDFDLEEMQVQQLALDIARAFKAPISVTADQVLTDAQWAARASMMLGFDAGGSLGVFAGLNLAVVSAFMLTVLDDPDAVTARQTLILDKQGANIAAAANINLDTATGDLVDVTGNTGITSITLAQGVEKVVRFTGTPNLTNGASLVLLSGVNIQTGPGDFAVFRGYAAGVVRMVAFFSATKGALVWVNGYTEDLTPEKLADFVLSYDASGVSVRKIRLQQLPYASMSISGLSYANGDGAGAGDLVNDITIFTGECRDSTDVTNMRLTANITKQLDAAWAVGTNAGGLDTGAIGNNDYYIWMIRRSDTGVVDALFSLSSTAPNMPANYDSKRLIGWFKRVAGTIVAFHTYETEGGGLEFTWDNPTQDINLSNTLTTARRTDAVKVPLNFSTRAILLININDASSAQQALFYCPDQSDIVPSSSIANYESTTSTSQPRQIAVRTSATGTIAARSTLATSDGYLVATMGFQWARRN